jgi:hypothetical protein
LKSGLLLCSASIVAIQSLAMPRSACSFMIVMIARQTPQ